MPFDSAAFRRRRALLGISQVDLAVIAGVGEHTIGRLEREDAPNQGGNITIDTVSRLCAALQMEYDELIIPPVGNMYERAVTFAYREHSPGQAPKLHDKGRSLRAQGFRRITGVRTIADEAIIERREEEPLEVIAERYGWRRGTEEDRERLGLQEFVRGPLFFVRADGHPMGWVVFSSHEVDFERAFVMANANLERREEEPDLVRILAVPVDEHGLELPQGQTKAEPTEDARENFNFRDPSSE